MPLITQMIRMRRFEEFVTQLVEMNNDEMEDKSLWEVWLHKIFDKTFSEFRSEITGENTAAPTQKEMESTVTESFDLLAGFVPDEGLVDRNGTVQTAGYDSD